MGALTEGAFLFGSASCYFRRRLRGIQASAPSTVLENRKLQSVWHIKKLPGLQLNWTMRD